MIDTKEPLTGSAVNGRWPRAASLDERDPGLAAHRRAVLNTLMWAEESATRGRYADALAWMNVLDVIGEELSPDYETKRIEWRRALAELTARRPHCVPRRAVSAVETGPDPPSDARGRTGSACAL